MDTLLQHAYIARLDETLFCPSNASPIDSPFLLSSIIARSSEHRGDATISEGDAIRPTPENTAEVHDDSGLYQVTDNQSDHIVTSIPASWLNQHANNLLQDVNHGDSLVSVSPNATAPTRSAVEQSASFIPQDFTSGFGSWATIDSTLHSARPPLSSYTVDHSAVVMDDQRGSYDFSDFLERWRRRDSHAPASVEALRPSRNDQELSEDVTRSDLPRKQVDVQGLSWDSVDRKTALDNRRSWHPDSTDNVFPIGVRYRERPKPADSEAYHHFRRFSPQHRAQVSHHQLRNVVASNSRSDILYAAGDKVHRTSLALRDVPDTVMDLSAPKTCASGFRITCLATSPASHSDNVVFAGGFNGEYAMLDLNSEVGGTSEGFVSHAYNGVVTHINTGHDRSSGQLRAAFSSNDQCLRVMDVATAQFINVHRFDHAINCSDVSTANRLRVVVGDSEEAIITDADKGEILVRLKGHTNHIFACKWSPDGRFIATGAEDGKVKVWDARNWRNPLATRSCLMSSPRSLHFTDDGFLLAAEDEDVVCIYEPQQFALRQSIRFFGAVSGVALLDGGAEIVVANGDRTVGGLLSYQRTAQGLNARTYAKRPSDDAVDGALQYRRRKYNSSWKADFDVLV